MRKGLLAIALAAAFPAVLAQERQTTNGVELYGIVDIGGEFVDNGAVSANKITSGLSTGSRWGIRGREDLGGGYAAIFTLESRFEIDTGQLSNNGAIYYCGAPARCPSVVLTSPLPPTVAPAILGGVNAVNAALLQAVSTVNSPNALFDRQAYAGLITPFGAVLAGRQYTPGYEVLVKYNSFYDSFAGNPGQIATINLRANNAIQYRAEMKGFALSAMYGFGGAEGTAGGRNERSTVTRGDDFWGMNLQYAAPAFGVGAAYQQNRTVTYAAPNENRKGHRHRWQPDGDQQHPERPVHQPLRRQLAARRGRRHGPRPVSPRPGVGTRQRQTDRRLQPRRRLLAQRLGHRGRYCRFVRHRLLLLPVQAHLAVRRRGAGQ